MSQELTTGERGIRAKYGGKLAKAINRAIRAEIPEGNAALDRLTQLAGPARHSGWKDRRGQATPEAAAYFKHKREVVDKLEAEVRGKWGIAMERVPLTKPRRGQRRGKPNRR